MSRWRRKASDSGSRCSIRSPRSSNGLRSTSGIHFRVVWRPELRGCPRDALLTVLAAPHHSVSEKEKLEILTNHEQNVFLSELHQSIKIIKIHFTNIEYFVKCGVFCKKNWLLFYLPFRYEHWSYSESGAESSEPYDADIIGGGKSDAALSTYPWWRIWCPQLYQHGKNKCCNIYY